VEEVNMGSIKLTPKEKNMEWDYDSEADVLYISFGAPRPAVGVDMGNGVIMRSMKNRTRSWALLSSGWEHQQGTGEEVPDIQRKSQPPSLPGSQLFDFERPDGGNPTSTKKNASGSETVPNFMLVLVQSESCCW